MAVNRFFYKEVFSFTSGIYTTASNIPNHIKTTCCKISAVISRLVKKALSSIASFFTYAKSRMQSKFKPQKPILTPKPTPTTPPNPPPAPEDLAPSDLSKMCVICLDTDGGPSTEENSQVLECCKGRIHHECLTIWRENPGLACPNLSCPTQSLSQ